jgi:ABC-type transporter MlaC component
MLATYRYLNFGLIVWLLFTFARNAGAESPKEQLQSTINRVIEVLRTIKSPADIERNRHSLRQALLTRFDFAAMAQQSLGNRWSDVAGKEKEFISAFTDFVEHAYMSTLGSYRGEEVAYDRDRLEGESAEVDTRVIGGEGAPIRILYMLHLRVNTGWSRMRLSMTSASLQTIDLSSRGFLGRLRWRSSFNACARHPALSELDEMSARAEDAKLALVGEKSGLTSSN